MVRARLAFLWHMHQPMYQDPETGEFILPWVRLHSTRAYYDMPKVLAEFPQARATINLVPSLLAQLEEYLAGRARDRFLTLTQKPAADLEPAERAFVLRSFFMADWETCIKPLPRLWELLQKRGLDASQVDFLRAAADFTAGEIRDVQVLFNLAWFGFRAFEEEASLRALKAKGRDFTEDDKAVMLAVQLKILKGVMPALSAVAQSGQAELTVTSFYHPILPLLCDSDSARRAMPQATLPTRFQYPDDAAEQVRRALDFAESRLGVRPKGMWPAEGSVSPEAMEIFAREGVEYVCSDEGVLLRSLPPGTARGPAVAQTYSFDVPGGRSVKMLFRDRGLSDLIGFNYAKSPANLAVADFLGHLARIADAVPAGGDVPTVGVILDGENPWEHYPESGRDFLRELYGALDQRVGGIEPVTLSEAFARSPPKVKLTRLHSGSWIDSNYRIWIGHPEDNLGWEMLGKARKLLDEKHAAGYDPVKLSQARDALLVAEGSDWFWWYGDDFTTESAAEFDALFRGYVARAFALLGEPAPARLEQPIARRARDLQVGSGDAVREPDALIHPEVDGRTVNFYAWSGASTYHPVGDRGAMHQGDGLFDRLAYGFDLERLYLRLDPKGGHEALQGLVDAVVVEVRGPKGENAVRVALDGQAEQRPQLGASGGMGRAAFRDILTVALPFADLGLREGDRVALSVRALRGEVEVERLPRSGHLRFSVPGPDFDRVHWRV